MAKSNLSHWSNDTAGTKNFEPIQPNLFDVYITPPAKLKTENLEILAEHINTVGGLQNINPATDVITQKFRNTTRSYMGIPTETSVDITIEFSMNLNDKNQAYTYKILRDWWRLGYDPDTGYCGIKKDYTGYIEIVQYNRNGDIFRRVKLSNCFITTAPEAMDSLDYNSADPMTASITIRCDSPIEELS